jgi:hypothetical protein
MVTVHFLAGVDYFRPWEEPEHIFMRALLGAPYARRLDTMGIFDRVSRWLRRESEQRYENVTVTNLEDGTTIKGHDAVKEYFRKESDLFERHGSSIIFQVYRINLEAKAVEELQGEKLMEIKVDGEFVSGADTVAAIKKKVRPVIEERSRVVPEAETRPGLIIDEADRISFILSGRPMQDDGLFYADHYILLPVWVQVFLHRCDFEQVIALWSSLPTKPNI